MEQLLKLTKTNDQSFDPFGFDQIGMLDAPRYGLTAAEIDAYAMKNDLRIVSPMPNEVQVDIDAKELPSNFEEQLGIFDERMKVKSYFTTRSKSGNLHVTVRFWRVIEPILKPGIGAMLGSDRKREALNFLNVQGGRWRPIFFYELNGDKYNAPVEFPYVRKASK